MNDETRAEATAWLSKAGGDLRAAEILSAPENDQGAAAVYHCQQAAEKAVKALLVYRETPFPKTHDIERLVEMVNEDGALLSGLIEHARILTPYAIDFRYPGDFVEPDAEETETALRLAREVLDTVSELLKS